MRSTLYLKFIIVYIIFGFLSLFTVATLTSSLMETPMQNYLTSTMYTEANLIANNYLSSYFSNELDINYPYHKNHLLPMVLNDQFPNHMVYLAFHNHLF